MADETTTVAQDATAEAAQDAGRTFDESYVKALRKEAAQHRTEAATLKAKLSEYEQAQMTETDRLRQQAEQAKAEAQAATKRANEAIANAAVSRAAAQHGIDPNLLYRLVDVEFGVDGMPVNVDASVANVLKQYPQLKPATATGVSTTNPARVQKLTMDDIRRMSPDQINARWDEVSLVMAGG